MNLQVCHKFLLMKYYNYLSFNASMLALLSYLNLGGKNNPIQKVNPSGRASFVTNGVYYIGSKKSILGLIYLFHSAQDMCKHK
jgi:hypothetical protein